jgi:hypothetical protein
MAKAKRIKKVIPMNIILSPGQAVRVTLEGTDGEFIVEWVPNKCVRVKADLPDTSGRVGVIYEEVIPPLSGPRESSRLSTAVTKSLAKARTARNRRFNNRRLS